MRSQELAGFGKQQRGGPGKSSCICMVAMMATTHAIAQHVLLHQFVHAPADCNVFHCSHFSADMLVSMSKHASLNLHVLC